MKTIELKWIEDDNHVVAEDAYNGLKDLIASGVFPDLKTKCEDDTLYITGEKEDLDKAVMKIQKAYAKYGQIMIKEAKNGVSQELRIESFDENVQDIFNHTVEDYNKFKATKERPLNYVKQLNDYRFKFKKFYETAARSDKKLLKPYLDEISNLLDESEIVNKIKPIKKINEDSLDDIIPIKNNTKIDPKQGYFKLYGFVNKYECPPNKLVKALKKVSLKAGINNDYDYPVYYAVVKNEGNSIYKLLKAIYDAGVESTGYLTSDDDSDKDNWHKLVKQIIFKMDSSLYYDSINETPESIYKSLFEPKYGKLTESEEDTMIEMAKNICEAAGRKVVNPENVETIDDVKDELKALGYNDWQVKGLVKEYFKIAWRKLSSGASAADVAQYIDETYMNESADNELTKHLSNLRNWGIIEENMNRKQYNDKYDRVALAYARETGMDLDDAYDELMDVDELVNWIEGPYNVNEIIQKLLYESTDMNESFLSPGEMKKKLQRVAARWASIQGIKFEDSYNELRRKKSVKDMLDFYTVDEIIDDLNKQKNKEIKEEDDELEEEI